MASRSTVLVAKDISKSYGDRTIIDRLSLIVREGEAVALTGRNGAGKSTLLRIMAGVDTEIDGEARPMPGIKVGYLPQEPQLDPSKTVRDIVEEIGRAHV